MKYPNPTGYTGKKANSDHSGIARFGSNAEVQAGSSDELIVSPSGLQAIIDTDDTFASASNTLVPSQLATKTYADNLAIAGAPAWSETVSGIGQLSTSAEATTGTNDDTAMTPLKVAAVLAAPPAIGSGTPAAGSFTTIAASGLSSLSGSATILTGGTALNLASDASTDAVNIATGAASRTITLGNVSGSTSVTVNTGTGNFAVNTTGTGDIILNSDDTMLLDSDGVLELNSSAGVINIGNDDVDQNINLGTDGERDVVIGSQNGAASLTLDSGTGAIDIGTTIAKSITIGNKITISALALECGTGHFTLDGVATSNYTVGATTTSGTMTFGGTAGTGTMTFGDSSATQTVQIGSGEGATTVSLADGATNPNAVTIATGAVANTVTIGSASAGAMTVDTAAGLSLDAATASNFTVTGATEDLTLQSSAGRVVVKGEEAAVSAVELVSAAGGISASSALQLSLISSEAAQADSVRIQASAADGGIDVDAGTGGLTLDSTGAISIDAAAASNFSVSGAGIDLDLASAGGRIIATSGEDAADSIYLHANAGTSETIRLHSDLGTGAASVHLESDVGGVTLTSGLASADAINLSASAGGVDVDGALQVNIASSQAATGAVTISASDVAGNITNTGAVAYTPDSITSDNAGVSASVNTVVTLITTDGDSNLDAVNLADGLIAGQIKHFAVVAVGNAADSVKIVPTNFVGGTQITFSASPLGLGCSMVFDGTNWTCFANNGGVIA